MVTDQAEVIRWVDLQPTAWKNGGGVTREVAASPEGSDMADFDWRVSIADVESAGPFSRFPGVDRVITLLEGGSMILESEGEDTLLATHVPHLFPGEASVACRLPDGPTRDLNLMTRRGRASGDVIVHTVSSPLLVDGGAARHLVIALEDGVTIAGDLDQAWTLDCYDVLGLHAAVRVTSGVVAVIQIR